MHYLIISYTHKNTNLQTREKLAFNDEDKLKSFYEKVIILHGVNEVVIISTCNRVELLLSINETENTKEEILDLLSIHAKLPRREMSDYGKIYEDQKAIKHMFMVASSLDSLVVGETQIVGQIKDAFAYSYKNGYCGQKIARVMHHAFRCAATVRNSTEISKNPVSIASAAVAKAKDIFGGNLGGYTAVIVGAGEMGSLAAKHLANAKVNLIIINRDIQRAQDLADTIEGVMVTVKPFSALHEIINEYRLLFSGTGADYAVITQSMIKQVPFQRYWFDMAVPRDIEEFEDENIAVYAVDDLQEIVDKNLAMREESAKVAYAIVEEFTQEFFKWLQTLAVDPLIKEIRQKAKVCSEKEIQRAIKKGFIPSEYEEQVTKVIHLAFNGFLHKPTKRLKTIAEQPQADTIVQSIQYFFDLNSDQRKAINIYKCEYQIEKDL